MNIKEELAKAFQEFYGNIISHAPEAIIGILTLLFFFFLARFLRSQIQTRLPKQVDDQMVVNAIARTVYLVIVTLGIVLFLRQLGWGDIAGGLLAGAGVSAIVIGFAFKDIAENFLAGFFLAFSRPFSIGDLIQINEFKGTVRSMHYRSTHIRTSDGKDIYMPNGMLMKNPLINYTRDGLLRHDFLIGLDYGDNIPKAIQVIIQIVKSYEHLADGSGLAPFVIIDEYSISTINLRTFYWINHKEVTIPTFELKNNLMTDIVTQLTKEGFSMPADILELKTYQEDKPISVSMFQKKLAGDSSTKTT
ncbi:MAG: small-conductance mechanosensitive channel [Flammeovirgaceae bacterium]|jgi:small conductance mechanosensitive channel